jgi:hypothetical protein
MVSALKYVETLNAGSLFDKLTTRSFPGCRVYQHPLS